ncbi:hypothetical protein GQ53DRAFT_775393 [Thozetella sp. PMI_491]|nr:hypothetical protein GQ53DRAFT_775393 [Thozetella sp. PMI_491]
MELGRLGTFRAVRSSSVASCLCPPAGCVPPPATPSVGQGQRSQKKDGAATFYGGKREDSGEVAAYVSLFPTSAFRIKDQRPRDPVNGASARSTVAKTTSSRLASDGSDRCHLRLQSHRSVDM